MENKFSDFYLYLYPYCINQHFILCLNNFKVHSIAQKLLPLINILSKLDRNVSKIMSDFGLYFTFDM